MLAKTLISIGVIITVASIIWLGINVHSYVIEKAIRKTVSEECLK